MKDIRILTLYKQHYFNYYGLPLQSRYSCWGYYDGLDIEVGKKGQSLLFAGKSCTPISDLWYSQMELAHKVEGICSAQNIGIFRSIQEPFNDKGQIFWEENDKMPYFAAAFLQLEHPKEYYGIRIWVEEELHLEDEDKKNGKYFQALAYNTFDNADLVVLMQSNSVSSLETMIGRLEEKEDVVYLHSVMGVSEAYLCDCGGKVLADWQGMSCFIEEPIEQITMKMVTNGAIHVKSAINPKYVGSGKELVRDEKVTFAQVTGHENLIVAIYDTRVEILLALLLPGGFATHQNPGYGCGLYNIETSIQMKSEEWESGEMLSASKNPGQVDWCQRKLREYKEEFSQQLALGDDGMYAYLHAFIQTLNILEQYERFDMAKDIFYLLFPAFDLFDIQFKRVWAEWNVDKESSAYTEYDKNEKMQIVRSSICQFLDSVNSVIYHTVHTDQIFLMVPGYCGTTYELPVKLCLFYEWFICEIITILNDSRENYKYQCLLVPGMESKPSTELISMGLPHGNRLICLRLSQRSLHMPRNLMLIIAHEVAHYVGEEIRLRKKRLELIADIVANVLTEGIIPLKFQWEGECASEVVCQFKEYNRRRIYELIRNKLFEECKEGAESVEAGFHACYIKELLIEKCEEILLDEINGVYPIIYLIPSSLIDENGANGHIKGMKVIWQIQRQFDFYRKKILAFELIPQLVGMLVSMYKEVFADVSAYAILKFDISVFRESYWVSEGKIIEDTVPEQKMREIVIKDIMKASELELESYEDRDYGDLNRLTDFLYTYDFTQTGLVKYANECFKEISSRLTGKEDMTELREVFADFCEPEKFESVQIYETILSKICSYKEQVENEYLNNP